MNSLAGTDTAKLWMVLLSVVVGVGTLAVIIAVFYTWKRRLLEEEPLPQCNLQARLAQIAQQNAPHEPSAA